MILYTGTSYYSHNYILNIKSHFYSLLEIISTKKYKTENENKKRKNILQSYVCATFRLRLGEACPDGQSVKSWSGYTG